MRSRRASVAAIVLGLAMTFADSSPWAGPSDAIVARVGPTPIMRATVEGRVAARIARTMFHRGPTDEERARIEREVLAQLIDEQLYRLEAARRGLVAPDGAVDERIAAEVRRLGGEERLTMLLAKRGWTLAELRAELAQQIVVQRLLAAVDAEVGPVSRAAAEAYYQEHRERYVVPRAWRLLEVQVRLDPRAPSQSRPAARARAEKIVAELRDGADFETVESKSSRDVFRDHGWVHEGSLQPEIAEIVEQLLQQPDGGVSGPVEFTMGFQIVQLLGRRPARRLAFAEVADAVIGERTRAARDAARSALLEACRARWPVQIISAADTDR